MDERLLHALDLAMLADWESAKQCLEGADDAVSARLTALMNDQIRRERDRAEMQALARHELGNALSIAQANVEAMIDGVLDTTTERLSGISEALQTCGMLLDNLKKNYQSPGDAVEREDFVNVCEVICAQISTVAQIAGSKNVRVHYDDCHGDHAGCVYRGDHERLTHVLRNMLLSAVRYTPPGGAIHISRLAPGGHMHFSVRHPSVGAPGKLVDALGGEARITSESPTHNAFAVRLPLLATV